MSIKGIKSESLSNILLIELQFLAYFLIGLLLYFITITQLDKIVLFSANKIY